MSSPRRPAANKKEINAASKQQQQDSAAATFQYLNGSFLNRALGGTTAAMSGDQQLNSSITAAGTPTNAVSPMIGGSSAALIQQLFRQKMTEMLTQHANTRGAIIAQETDGAKDIMDQFEAIKKDIAVYEKKQVEAAAQRERERTRNATYALRVTQAALRTMEQEDERIARSGYLVREERSRVALLRLHDIALAQLQCHECLVQLQQVESNRRNFLLSFEEREWREMEDSEVGSTLWRPGMQSLGCCPFLRPMTDCPFASTGRCYGLPIVGTHLPAQRNNHAVGSVVVAHQ